MFGHSLFLIIVIGTLLVQVLARPGAVRLPCLPCLPCLPWPATLCARSARAQSVRRMGARMPCHGRVEAQTASVKRAIPRV